MREQLRQRSYARHSKLQIHNLSTHGESSSNNWPGVINEQRTRIDFGVVAKYLRARIFLLDSVTNLDILFIHISFLVCVFYTFYRLRLP